MISFRFFFFSFRVSRRLPPRVTKSASYRFLGVSASSISWSRSLPDRLLLLLFRSLVACGIYVISTIFLFSLALSILISIIARTHLFRYQVRSVFISDLTARSTSAHCLHRQTPSQNRSEFPDRPTSFRLNTTASSASLRL